MFFSKAIQNKTAGYFRLSREDGDKMESDSIRNQKDLVTDYISKHPEITLVKEYVDDGYTGTNFDRPGFQKLLVCRRYTDDGDYQMFHKNWFAVTQGISYKAVEEGCRVSALVDCQ